MSILVVGSVAYDSVTTPLGSKQDALGGSATYFAIAGSYFAPVSIVAVVGDDFGDEGLALLRRHGVDVTGLKTVPGKTFRWAGEYSRQDVNSRRTLDTQLNVFADFEPKLTPRHSRLPYLFLANIDPGLQLNVLEQMEERPRLVAADTMNFWIEGHRAALAKVIERVDVLMLDEQEVRLLTGEASVVTAARHVLGLGPRLVIVKRGEHGVIQFMGDSIFAAPSYPVERVVDPTGAGDSFAGGFMGYLAATSDLSLAGFRRAAIVGSVMGSFAVESFSVERTCSLTRHDLVARLSEFTRLTQFDGLEGDEALPWYRDVGVSKNALIPSPSPRGRRVTEGRIEGEGELFGSKDKQGGR